LKGMGIRGGRSWLLCWTIGKVSLMTGFTGITYSEI
jgi:hypothetical protein